MRNLSRSKYRDLLAEDSNFRRWYENVARGSLIVADTYLRRLTYFCRYFNMTPREYAEPPKQKIEEMALESQQLLNVSEQSYYAL